MTMEQAMDRLGYDGRNFFAAAVGPKGVKEEEILALDGRLADLHGKLSRWRANAEPSFLGLPFVADLEEVRALGQEWLSRYRNFVVFGIGGSSLGGQMLVETLGTPEGKARVRFYDNVDPVFLADLDQYDWEDTAVIAISKSGDTAETLSQLLVVLPRMEAAVGKEGLREQLLIITESEKGALYQIAQALLLRVIWHPHVGGRYIVLSAVGLLPAYLAGVDVDSLMAGAHVQAERCAQPGLKENPALWWGAAQYLLLEKGMGTAQWMVYSEEQVLVVDWYRQLCAESLGKHDAKGQEQGLSPVFAKGVTDQHSQLQLYLDGPSDKQFTFLTALELAQMGAQIPVRFAEIPAVKPLAGHRLGELFHAEFLGTRETVTRRGRPNRTFTIGLSDAYALGQLIVQLETETVVIGHLLGVDPFDQPAVEESKVLAREYLGRMGGASDDAAGRQ